MPVDQYVRNVRHLHGLIGVEPALEFEAREDGVWVLNQDLVPRLDVVVHHQRLVCVINREHAKVILKVDDEEAHGYLLVLGQICHNLGAQNDVAVLASLELS